MQGSEGNWMRKEGRKKRREWKGRVDIKAPMWERERN